MHSVLMISSTSIRAQSLKCPIKQRSPSLKTVLSIPTRQQHLPNCWLTPLWPNSSKILQRTYKPLYIHAVVQELHSKHFTVEYEGATLSLETSDIYYLESHGHKVLIHCKGQDLTLRMTIPEALEQLPKRCFASPHKSYLVNM